MAVLLFVALICLGLVALGTTVSAASYKRELIKLRNEPRQLPSPEKDAAIRVYEDFLLRVAADDVGDPPLEARLVINDVRRKLTY